MREKHKTKKLAAIMMACMMALTIMFGNIPGLSLDVKAAGPTMSDHFGIPGNAVVQELKSHENDGYYLGTPYRSLFDYMALPEACISPNGNPNGHGPGMNCTGFVASVMQRCGADLSAIANNGRPGREANAVNWYEYFIAGNRIEYHTFNNVPELLASGHAEKGDVIFFYPTDLSHPDADYHIGFFWGDSPDDNKFWHSFETSNFISGIAPKFEPSIVYLMKVGKPQPFDPITTLLQKEDANNGTNSAQGNAGLAGAQFTVEFYEDEYYSTLEEVAGVKPTRTWIFETDLMGYADFDVSHFVGGDTFYTNSNGRIGMPPGTVTVQETQAPTGYLLNDTLYIQQITADSLGEIVQHYNAPIVPENVIRGGIRIKKWDAELNANNPQGDAVLEGTVLDIFNRSTNSVWVNGTEYAPGAVVATIQTDASGAVETANDLLPYGDYEITERTPPNGYLDTGVTSRTFSITENGAIVNLNDDSTAIKNNPIRGGVRIEKWDNEFDANRPQGSAVLGDAAFDIINRSTNPVLVGGTVFAPGDVVATLRTNMAGVVETANNLLPYGEYEIIETTPPEGYLNTGVTSRMFSITENGVIVDMNTSDTAIKNNPIRGGVRIEKWDNEINANTAQGGATLEGAVFDIINMSVNPVLVDGVEYAPGEVVVTIQTDATGAVATASDLLPYGEYEIIETAPPAGYLPTGVTSREFSIRENGVIVNMNTSDTAIKNDPIRGDIEFSKRAEDMSTMSLVKFSITSKTTGETHNFVTDENGYWSSHSNWNLHSQDTNRGKTEYDGIWFGDISTLDDDKGALLYDTYIIQELRCAGNMGMELVSFEVTVRRHNKTVDLGSIFDKYEQPPEIGTTAIDSASGTHTATPGGQTTIIDTVTYSGLKVGQAYTIKGILMDKATGEPLLVNGEEVTVSKPFTPSAPDGTEEVSFTFDSSALAGKSVVVFETLYQDDKEVAVHADIDDEGQTVTFTTPEIGTTAIDADSGTHTATAGGQTTIIDTVQYWGLTVGQQYGVAGILMDKATGNPLLVNGEEVTATSDPFTPTTPDGTVDVVFTFDSNGLAGKSVVVFESLYIIDGGVIATHEDITDEGQTVTFTPPEIGTTAIDAESGTHTATPGSHTTIIDTVTYSGLTVGQEYTVNGVLMDKATKSPVLVNDEEVTAKSEPFTPETPDGTVDVVFTFDSTGLEGTSTVVFETLYQDGKEVAVHADINDMGQTVTFKEIFGKLRIFKVDADNNEPLAGAEFTVYDENDKAAGTFISGSDGWAEITLPGGKYTVKETKAPEGFVINELVYPFEIIEDDAVIPLTMLNSRTVGELELRNPDNVKPFPKTSMSRSLNENAVI